MTQHSNHSPLPRPIEEAQQEVRETRLPWSRARRRGRLLLGLYTFLLVLFGLLTWWVAVHPLPDLDVTITRTFQEIHASWLQLVMQVVSFLASVPVLIVLTLLAAVLFWLVHLRLEAVILVGLGAVCFLLNWSIKLLVHRPRPSAKLVEVVQQSSGSSFPSAHVMGALAFWGLLFFFGLLLFQEKRWWRLVLLTFPVVLLVLVGPARIYLGDHWASDVIGAYLLGAAILGLALWLYLLLKDKGVLATSTRKKEPA